MAISRPDLDRGPSGEAPTGDLHSPPERDRVQARAASRAHPREADGSATPDGEGGRVLAFPVEAADTDRDGTVVLIQDAELVPAGGATGARVRELSSRWVAEVRETATVALDGSVWRARPAALRDIHARTQRSEWTTSPALVIAGQAYGWVALTIVAALYAAAEVVKRPTRLALVIIIVGVIWFASTFSGDAPTSGVTDAADAAGVNVTVNDPGKG